jgi:uncharacterized SAM-binding protein YcdF (DUF218 family)
MTHISLLIILISIYNIYAFDKNIYNIIVVLGSADNNILNERIKSTIEFINNSDSSCILYLSGGVKHSFSKEASEASIMASVFSSNTQNVRIVLDEMSKNTAENFVNLKKWVYNNFLKDNLPNILISTSDFHKNRAELIFKGIFSEVVPEWVLSKSDCLSCWNDERFHIRNVDSDIKKALNI